MKTLIFFLALFPALAHECQDKGFVEKKGIKITCIAMPAHLDVAVAGNGDLEISVKYKVNGAEQIAQSNSTTKVPILLPVVAKITEIKVNGVLF